MKIFVDIIRVCGDVCPCGTRMCCVSLPRVIVLWMRIDAGSLYRVGL